MHQAAPLRAVSTPITDPERLAHLDIRRNDRLGGILHEYQHAA
jgi:putative transposase